MQKNIVFSFTWLLLWLEVALCYVYYITPSSDDCPQSPCVTLENITAIDIVSNTTLIFLFGNHNLNISTLTMLSNSDDSTPVLSCIQQGGFANIRR